MLKKYFNFFIMVFASYWGKIFRFYVPNFLTKVKIEMTTVSVFNQKTLFTGSGSVSIGQNCAFGYKLGGFHRNGIIEFQARYKNALIKIGDNVATNNNLFFCAANKIQIGSDTLIGQNVTIMDFEAHDVHPKKRKQVGEIGEIIIGKNVWIGNDVIILKNTFIGDNSIVAAGAVVTGNFPENVILGGVPAKIIKAIEEI